MPLYEYVCATCEEKFEELRSASQADAPATCPECGSTETARQFSSFATASGSSGSSAPRASSCGSRGFT